MLITLLGEEKELLMFFTLSSAQLVVSQSAFSLFKRDVWRIIAMEM